MFAFNRLLSLNPFRAKAAAFHDFDRMLNWRLLRGSHVFPGPDGGTCINEAAIIAAGHPYRPVRSIEDCPKSFSRPMAAYALFLNDLIEWDSLRNSVLMPFVTRLEGSADEAEVEKKRAELIVLRTASTVFSSALTYHGLFEAAGKLRKLETPDDLMRVAQGLFGSREKRSDMPTLWMTQALAELVEAARACTRGDLATAAKSAAIATGNIAQGMQRTSVRRGHRALARVYREAREILAAALKLGKADSLDIGLAVERLAKAKRAAAPGCLAPVL
ncbi:MAG TPA: hypothetical protein VKT73_13835 [Xanthobacteraceae bacterium]|nr:hypothetical protein [Xanthobacteraceae bacterium]